MDPRRLVPLGVLLSIAVLFAGCGGDDDVTAGTSPSTEAGPGSTAPATTTVPPEDRGGPDDPSSAPPPVVVTGAGPAMELEPWTYCYGALCADGAPPEDPPDVGATDTVQVAFPLDDWTFEATFEAVGQECPRRITVPVVEGPDGSLAVEPAGRPGTYDVTLFGRGDGEGGGDLFVTFRWTTSAEGVLPEPAARLAVLADHDGVVDSYGVELVLSDMAATPTAADATITVRSREGREHRFTATLQASCVSEGSVSWNGPIEDGEVASALGTAPFTYEVEVVLDGVSHRAVAVWPGEQIAGNEPSVALTFDPPLTAMP